MWVLTLVIGAFIGEQRRGKKGGKKFEKFFHGWAHFKALLRF
jgi:hypothetical protein